MVEKVPDSTYEMAGGLDKQITETKEVLELPVKHPVLFEALSIAYLKVSCCTVLLLARAVAHPRIASSLGLAEVFWCRNTLERVVGWYASCL